MRNRNTTLVKQINIQSIIFGMKILSVETQESWQKQGWVIFWRWEVSRDITERMGKLVYLIARNCAKSDQAKSDPLLPHCWQRHCRALKLPKVDWADGWPPVQSSNELSITSETLPSECGLQGLEESEWTKMVIPANNLVKACGAALWHRPELTVKANSSRTKYRVFQKRQKFFWP